MREDDIEKDGEVAPTPAKHLAERRKAHLEHFRARTKHIERKAKDLKEQAKHPGGGAPAGTPRFPEPAKKLTMGKSAATMKLGPGQAPPGYTPIPGSKHGGYHKQVGGVWRTWYKETGLGPHPTERMTDEQHSSGHKEWLTTPEGRRQRVEDASRAIGGGEPDPNMSDTTRSAVEMLHDKTVRVLHPKKPAEAAKAKPSAATGAEKLAARAKKVADAAKTKPAKKPAAKPKAGAWESMLPKDILDELDKRPPPGATDVKVHLNHADPHASVVLTWRDAQGRKNSAYTHEHAARSAARKFSRVVRLLHRQDAVRAGARRLSAAADTPRQRDAAVAVALVEATGLRPGSRAAAGRSSGATFGVTSLRPEHVRFEGKNAILTFTGKASKTNTRTVTDPWLVKELKDRAQNPTATNRFHGGYLFSSTEQDANEAMRKLAGKEFKLKDLRTLWATHEGVKALNEAPALDLPADPAKRRKAVEKSINAASQRVADALGNTAPMARKSYIHPSVIATWLRWMGASDVIPDLFRSDAHAGAGLRDTSDDSILADAARLHAKLPEPGPCVEAEDDDGGDLEEFESYPADLVGEYAALLGT